VTWGNASAESFKPGNLCEAPQVVSIEALSFHAMQIDVMCKLWVKYANLVLASAEVTILVADVCGYAGDFNIQTLDLFFGSMDLKV